MTLSFLRADLLELAAYSPHPPSGGQVPNQPEGIVDPLDTNESPYDLPAQLKQKLAWMVEQQIAANRYPDGAYRELKAAIADYVNQSAQLLGTFTAHHITVGNGSDELIRSLLMATCLGGEGAILVANPTFSMYAILARTLGIPVVAVDRRESDFAMDLEAAQAAITDAAAPPIRVVFVVHPNSPTGNGLTTAEINWLEQLPEQILVVVDEAYFEFSQHTTVTRVVNRPNWLVLRTFSKAFRLAAYRVGYGVGHPGLIAALEKVRLPYNLPSIAQSAASLALAH
ncbi:MAG: histidinol-phosphate transaminase, partial [Nodosilinea sp.]